MVVIIKESFSMFNYDKSTVTRIGPQEYLFHGLVDLISSFDMISSFSFWLKLKSQLTAGPRLLSIFEYTVIISPLLVTSNDVSDIE